jgi:hypothetical protein
MKIFAVIVICVLITQLVPTTYANKIYQLCTKTPRERNLKSIQSIKSIHENVRYHCKLCPYTKIRARYISEHVKFIKN